ncbi:hypothetical protein [Prescottella equi]|uniref:hypothetical protein n=1 Tax=Rhodococcus hoagii TaxID=43767 RepID=UPI001C778392|nr:hypothetical protein [Prescottella equi]BCN51602.1 hypothetical protein RE9416_49030 [Prescottella equi]BCN56623.1 hypothetical protein RE9425_50130 [Prescottella equi]BCN61537.1 hypothetical protein RE9427_49070 [Prescottella equi]BCN86340.1 hypothetical protein RE0356_49810 [Prescottella equi]
MNALTRSRSLPLIVATTLALVALVAGLVLRSAPMSAPSAAGQASATRIWEGPPDTVLTTSDGDAIQVELASFSPARTNVAAQTARFAGCLGGFGFVAAPIVAGFMFGGPGGAISAAKAWLPRLGPVGGGIMKWCMQAILGVRM